ncbi:hypothetical protein PRZ48_014121 [Zasmidium cellare]|uniref:Uncharacterized protein n=1 Tax=Zasmidium cellare TaxID=395010 RepID=A0ABR0E035_ZASCE|nr:hypothetical protein PRZ48_014121 [Zasmidium cellare]
MDQVWKYYSTLPDVIEADERFCDRTRLFQDIGRLLAEHGNEFGLCLVHRHCTLEEGEIMLSENGVSQPVQASLAADCYAERWLPSGQPFEFSSQSTETPSAALFSQFRALVGDDSSLGLYYAPQSSESEEMKRLLEWTEGRKNLTRQMTSDDIDLDTVETAWRCRAGGDYPQPVMDCQVQLGDIAFAALMFIVGVIKWPEEAYSSGKL